MIEDPELSMFAGSRDEDLGGTRLRRARKAGAAAAGRGGMVRGPARRRAAADPRAGEVSGVCRGDDRPERPGRISG